MNPFLNGLLNLLTVGVSEIFTSQGSFKGAMNNFGEILSNWGKTANDVGHQNMLGNWIAKMTGSRLTDAEMQANEWNEQQVLAAWNRQMEADNTKYQRQVADMQAAGLNPMLAAGGTLHAPSALVAQSVSPSAGTFGLDSILNMFKLGAELKNINADTNKKKAEADKAAADAAGQNIVNNYEDERQRLQNEGLGIANSLSRAQISEIKKQLEDYDSQISLRLKQEKSEDARVSLISAQAMLARANAFQVAELIPYSKALMSAQTEQAKQNAAFAAAQAAYQNGLLNSGMIESMVYRNIAEKKNINAQQRHTEARAAILEIEKSLKEGHNPENWSPDSISGALVGTIYNLLETINPLSKLGL